MPTLGDFELPIARPMEPEFGRPSTWPPGARVAGGCGLGCLIAVFLQALLIWGFTAFMFGTRPPDGLVTRVETPPNVTAGQQFPLTLVVRNEGAKAFTITSVTARSRLTRQLTLANPQPAPTNTLTLKALGSQVWEFRQTVEPGKSWTIRFQATPSRPSKLRGALEVQAGLTPIAVPFTLQVGGKEAPAKAGKASGASTQQ